MRRKMTPLGVWTLIGSLALGCSQGPGAPEYRPVLLGERTDPMAGEKNFTPWRPPRQMAAFVHPHEDLDQGVMVAGHWIMVLLGEGSWYFQEERDQEPVPDLEASAEDIRKALGAVSIPRDAVVPYRPKEGVKP